MFPKVKTETIDSPSSECKELIGRMLVVDAKQRATILEIAHHAWLTKDQNLGHVNKPWLQGMDIPHRNVVEIDQDVVKSMIEMGFAELEIIDSVNNNRYNDIHSNFHGNVRLLYEI